ncbi:hypothetical protein M501DRAFT_1011345 [Patellaria atrata CBS 101060]|uniref:D-serine dehydratase-like domain-containing protein n=1 Tax=Patellaria atrata CBS 101060 TaxID=1346257 RepID=A0A9P4S9I8_9PEZI|nr:hypothetical protein M501DRAFT_1011345 [Patellaria atrata CBS 101060]
MLKTARLLGVGSRAHVKTLKTTELATLKVGETGPVNLVCSTLVGMEELLRHCLMLYGFPAPPSAIKRIIRIAEILGGQCEDKPNVGILIDNIDALQIACKTIEKHIQSTGGPKCPIGLWIKIDTGYHRAGIPNGSPALEIFYSHDGHSYAGNNPDDANDGLLAELLVLKDVVEMAYACGLEGRFTLSVGATPTATAAHNLVASNSETARTLMGFLHRVKAYCDVELHAGVYPVLDLQQLATGVRPFPQISTSNIGFSILAEIASIYNRERPEALIAAGSLALSREPCKSYAGWGIVSPWRDKPDKWSAKKVEVFDPEIINWDGPLEKLQPLIVGEKLLIWPNYACIVGAHFGWYLVIDSDDTTGNANGYVIKDVWVRWRGW